MQHQVGIEDGLAGGDAASAEKGLFGDQVGMSGTCDMDQPVGRQGLGHRVAGCIEGVGLAGQDPVEDVDDAVAIKPAQFSHVCILPKSGETYRVPMGRAIGRPIIFGVET